MIEPRPFLFGKLPQHGDFVSRGLDPAAREAWDSWLSREIAAAREALGDFEDLYGSAPAWCFVIAPGRLGSHWQAGALTPSMDSVGRLFPAVLGAALADADAALACGEVIAQRCEELLLAQLGGASADQLASAIGAEQLDCEGEPGRTGWWTLGGERHAPQALAEQDAIDGLLVAMLTPEELE